MKMYNKMPGVITVLVVILSSLFTTEATTLLKMDLNELISRADLIVIGKAGTYSSQSDNGEIFTYTTFTVEQVIKGDVATKEVAVKTPGGEKDGIVMEVPGAPQLTAGGAYVLFLYSNTDKYMSNIVGWQGKYTVDNDIVQENGKSVTEFVNEITTILNNGQ